MFDKILKGEPTKADSLTGVGPDGKDATAELHYDLVQGEDTPEVRQDYILLAMSLGFTEEEAKKYFG